MADVELLPLPPLHIAPSVEPVDYPNVAQALMDYARANMEPLLAENERLRAEVEDYRTNGAAAVRFAPNSAHWSTELRRLFGDDARAGIEVLENGHRQELARAERLAEALQEAAGEMASIGDAIGHDHPEARRIFTLRANLLSARFAALAQEDRND